jgi:hypothetical protein
MRSYVPGFTLSPIFRDIKFALSYVNRGESQVTSSEWLSLVPTPHGISSANLVADRASGFHLYSQFGSRPSRLRQTYDFAERIRNSEVIALVDVVPTNRPLFSVA